MCKQNGNGKRITAQRIAFVNAYVGEAKFNATNAAAMAGYEGDRNTLAATGSRLLRIDKIRQLVANRLQESAMTADEVLARLAEIARGEVGEYIDDDGNFDYKRLIEDDKAHLIKKINRTVRHNKADEEWTERVTVEVYDSQRALETLAKHHGLLVDRHEIGEPGAFDPEAWKRKEREQMQQIADLEEPECATQDA